MLPGPYKAATQLEVALYTCPFPQAPIAPAFKIPKSLPDLSPPGSVESADLVEVEWKGTRITCPVTTLLVGTRELSASAHH